MLKRFSAITALLFLVAQLSQSGATRPAGWQFDFANKGYDFDQAIPPPGWTGVNRCGEPENQSPINLMQPLGIYGWIYGEPIPFEFDEFQLNYLNPRQGLKVKYDRKNYIMPVNQYDDEDQGKESLMQSVLPSNLYGSSVKQFQPNSFHFHHPAEHSINGNRYDIAFHLSHSPSNMKEGGTPLDVFGIQFSVDNYDQSLSQEDIQTLSDFFESLNLGSRNTSGGLFFQARVDFVSFMHTIDLQEAWIYSGSATFPPCVKPVFWRIVRRVYPIEYKHFYLIRQIYLDHQDELKATTNIRGIHQVNGHDVYFIGGQRLILTLIAAVPAILLFQ